MERKGRIYIGHIDFNRALLCADRIIAEYCGGITLRYDDSNGEGAKKEEVLQCHYPTDNQKSDEKSNWRTRVKDV